VQAREARLHSRAHDSDAVIAGRMNRAGHEMSHWAEYDYVVVNSNIDAAYQQVELILQAERLRRERQMWLSSFVRKLQKELER